MTRALYYLHSQLIGQLELLVPDVEHSTLVPPLHLSATLLHVETTSDLFPKLHPDFPEQHLASMSLAHSSQLLDSQATSNTRQTTPEITEHSCLITTLPHGVMLALALNGCTQDVNT